MGRRIQNLLATFIIMPAGVLVTLIVGITLAKRQDRIVKERVQFFRIVLQAMQEMLPRQDREKQVEMGKEAVYPFLFLS